MWVLPTPLLTRFETVLSVRITQAFDHLIGIGVSFPGPSSIRATYRAGFHVSPPDAGELPQCLGTRQGRSAHLGDLDRTKSKYAPFAGSRAVRAEVRGHRRDSYRLIS